MQIRAVCTCPPTHTYAQSKCAPKLVLLVRVLAHSYWYAHTHSYPGYSGPYFINGTVAVTETDTGIDLEGTMTGLPSSVSGGYVLRALV